jgi:leucyl aminopeptidase
MRYATAPFAQRPASQVLVIPFLQGEGAAQPAGPLPAGVLEALAPIWRTPDFAGKLQQTLLWYPDSATESRWLLLGLGEAQKITPEGLRRAYATVCQQAQLLKASEISLLIPKLEKIRPAEVLKHVVEGLELSNYHFGSYKKPENGLVEATYLLEVEPEALQSVQKTVTIVEGVKLARDLVNGNADEVTPQHLAETAQKLARTHAGLECTVFDKERLVQEGMGLILAVGAAAQHPPVLIQLRYRGAPDSSEHTVVLGKGVTFDTGGLNIKPTGSIETMKDDMAGAAAALGLMHVLATSKARCNVTVVIPSAENAVSSHSYKPGDVFRSYSGKTVEITNTDAEGRLLLADALAYARTQLQPTRMIDMATLTGGAIIALGHEVTALMSNNDALAEQLFRAGESTGERCWRLPLYEEYRPAMLADIADLKNSGGGRAASSIRGGIFLQEFVGETPWAHLDIAGTAYLTDSKQYGIKYATGVGVRLLSQLLGV